MDDVQRYKRILVPLDGSGLAERAIPHAIEVARSNAADLHLVHVLRLPVAEHAPEISLAGQDEKIDAARDYMRQYLLDLGEKLLSADFTVHTHLLEGADVAGLICDFVHRNRINLIVMSARGRTGLARLLFGSVARAIMECTDVPVLLLRPDDR